jgi:crotonobetainyl-CoA:carnitine CoA-transferase CaiB-like acyl-CoA transferase
MPIAGLRPSTRARTRPRTDPVARPDLIFETTGRYISVGTISDSEWRGFCAAAERPGLAEDSRFSTPGGRAGNATERILLMAQIIKQRASAQWLVRLDANDVPSAPVLRRGEVIANGQVSARELITEFDHSGSARFANPFRPHASTEPQPPSTGRRRASARAARRSWRNWGSTRRGSTGWPSKGSSVWQSRRC